MRRCRRHGTLALSENLPLRAGVHFRADHRRLQAD